MDDRMAKPIPERTSARIQMLRPLMVFGILWIHLNPPIAIARSYVDGPVTELLQVFIRQAFFFGALPMLTVISGYLFFSAAPRAYWSMTKRKTRSLVLPLLLWNVPFAAAIFMIQKYGLRAEPFPPQLFPLEPFALLNACIALKGTPVNPPLYFLRDLFVCFLVSPVLRAALNTRALLGFSVLFLAVVSRVDLVILVRPDILLLFYIGGFVATRGLDPTRLDRWAWPLFTLYVLLCVLLSLTLRDTDDGAPARSSFYFYLAIRMLGPAAFWALSGRLLDTRFGQFFKRRSDAAYKLLVPANMLNRAIPATCSRRP
jgi:succinoglycan biosynthesis protein ExoH